MSRYEISVVTSCIFVYIRHFPKNSRFSYIFKYSITYESSDSCVRESVSTLLQFKGFFFYT